MASINRTADATAEPVTVSELKEHGRILHNYEDTLLEVYLTNARNYCEKYLGQAFVSQTWEMKLDRWPRRTLTNEFGAIPLPYGPVQAVSSVSYVSASSTTATMPSTDYIVSASNVGRIAPGYSKHWPTTLCRPDAITVTWSAGYGGAAASTDATASAAAVPVNIKRAIMVYALHMYQARDEDAPIPRMVKDLLDSCSFGTHRMLAPDSY